MLSGFNRGLAAGLLHRNQCFTGNELRVDPAIEAGLAAGPAPACPKR